MPVNYPLISAVYLMLILFVSEISVSLYENKKETRKTARRLFLFWTSSYLFYLLAEMLYYICIVAWNDAIVILCLKFADALSLMMTYCFSGCWLLKMIKQKRTVPDYFFNSAIFVPAFLSVIKIILIFVTNDEFIPEIPNLFFLIFIFLIVVYYHSVFEKKEKSYIVCALCSMLFFVFGIYGFVISDIFVTMFVVSVYSEIWQRRGRGLIEEERKNAVLANKLTQSKINMAMSQIQPHFLYNTLNSIAALCDIDPKKAKDVTVRFSDYLRENLDTLNSDKPVSIEKELEHTKQYTDIEKVRFGNRLNIEYECLSEKFFLPSLTVQPIVENAVRHGIMKKVEGGSIKVKTFEDDAYFYVSVSDDGVGYSEDEINLNKKHYGIDSVRLRLKEMCGGSLILKSEKNKGTEALITLPKEESINENLYSR